MNLGNFRVSDGWFRRFKERYGVKFLKISNENLQSDRTRWPLYRKIEEDDSRVWFKLTPHILCWRNWIIMTITTWQNLCIFGWNNYAWTKNCQTMNHISRLYYALSCHKVKPLGIGKVKNSRYFWNFNNPSIYRSTKMLGCVTSRMKR